MRKYEGMEPEAVAKAEGLEIMEVEDMPPRLQDLLYSNTIIIRKCLCPAERRWRVAHCLGHHFLHRGNGSRLDPNKVIFNPRQEREADVFAGYLVGALTAPQWIHDVYWQFEPWKLEPWELVKQMQDGFNQLRKLKRMKDPPINSGDPHGRSVSVPIE